MTAKRGIDQWQMKGMLWSKAISEARWHILPGDAEENKHCVKISIKLREALELLSEFEHLEYKSLFTRLCKLYINI